MMQLDFSHFSPWAFFVQPFLDYDFMRRALLGGLLLALSSAPLGVFLVLRRMSLMGDALSHALLPGVAIGFLLAGPLLWAMGLGGLISGLLVSLLAGMIARHALLRFDSALAGVYLIALAFGVLLITEAGSRLDLLHILFGHLLAVDAQTLQWLLPLSLCSLILLAFLFRPLVMDCVDPSLFGGRRNRVPMFFLGLVTLNLVVGFTLTGTLLTIGLMILPALAARLCSQRLMVIIGVATALSGVSVYGGLLWSYHAGLPTGPAIILLAGTFYLLALLGVPFYNARVRDRKQHKTG